MTNTKTIITKSGEELKIGTSAVEDAFAQMFLNIGSHLKSLPVYKHERNPKAPLEISFEHISLKEGA